MQSETTAGRFRFAPLREAASLACSSRAATFDPARPDRRVGPSSACWWWSVTFPAFEPTR